MMVLYNLCQLVLLVALAPLWGLLCLRPKYRPRVFGRLGWQLAAHLPRQNGSPRIWVHALSVGEVSSSMPLVRALRKRYPRATLFFSTTTRTGTERAQSLVGEVDALIPFPLDILWVVRRFLRYLRPDLFLLVETDFWPNMLAALKQNRVPVLLVNGRISNDSFMGYRKFAWFFRAMFQSFSVLAVQSEADRERMLALGIPAAQVAVPGNLKYDCLVAEGKSGERSRHPAIPEAARYWVAGSTHPGEEAMLLAVQKRLLERDKDLLLVVAPRDIERSHDIQQYAESQGVVCALSSYGLVRAEARVLVLDRLGELLAAYAQADFAFVGGSLVDEGGHNPLEPAALGKPVLFGPHMDDFSDIVRDILGVFPDAQIQDPDSLYLLAEQLLSQKDRRVAVGQRLQDLVRERSGASSRYLALIEGLLAGAGRA